MNRESKAVKASEIYSRRTDNNTSETDDKKTDKNDSDSKWQSHSHSDSIKGMKNVDIRSVKENVVEAVEKGLSKDKDEIKQLAEKTVGVEAVALAEYNSIKATERTVHNGVKAVRYTVTRFSAENRQKRKENKEYSKNKKNLRKVNKEIRKNDKEIKQINKNADRDKKKAGNGGGEKAKTNQEKVSSLTERQKKLKQRKGQIKRRNREIKKRKTAQRHTRSISIIKQRAKNTAKGIKKDMIRTPNRFALMVADDLEADKLVMTASAGILYNISKAFGNAIKLLMHSIKSILFALFPVLSISIFLMFMIYIMFFSDFDSFFDLGIEKNMISSNEEAEDMGSIITAYITKRRNDMAKEITDSDSQIQVYFVKLEDGVINEASEYINEKSKELGTPTIMTDEWVHSNEADTVLKELAEKMCYRLTDEEAAVYTEENLEAYSGNAVLEPPEQPKEPETDITESKPGGEIGIGGGLGIGIGAGVIKPEQPEPETPAEQTIKKAIIGYYSVSDIQ